MSVYPVPVGAYRKGADCRLFTNEGVDRRPGASLAAQRVQLSRWLSLPGEPLPVRVVRHDAAMRTLVVTEFLSLDGVMEAPGGEPGYAHAGWVGPHFTPELGEFKLAEQLAADVLLLGRRTYESFYGAWPGRDDAMAEKINTMRKVVVSTTLGSSPWHDTTVVTDLSRVADLKAEKGGPVLVAGSRTLVAGLLAAGLVDEVHLQIFPVVLGSGARFWPEAATTTPVTLLVNSPLTNGVLLHSYQIDGDA